MTNQRALDTLKDRLRSGVIAPDMALSDAIDSLTLIDLFLDIEREYDSAIALDDVVACKTMADLCTLMEQAGALGHAVRERGQ